MLCPARKPFEAIPSLTSAYPGHIDIPRLRTGHLGGAFWTVWTPCEDPHAGTPQPPDYNTPSDALRNAFEMLDLIQNMIAQLPEHFQYAHSSQDIRDAFSQGKVASLIGLEGTHFLGNSLGAMRQLARLGVKYVTLTHFCHSAFGSSAGSGTPLKQVHEGNGLSTLGRELVLELNRLGVMVDLSHTSDETMREAIKLSRAPVVWTHSGARGVMRHPRNVPDDVLDLIGDAGEGKREGLVQSVFFPPFIGPTPESANLSRVADHIEWIAGKIGRNRVGIASDFDGMINSVEGLEDASKYPYLVSAKSSIWRETITDSMKIAEMIARGWTDTEVKGLLGENLMRIMDMVDEVKDSLEDELPSTYIYEKRTDLPSTHWGGGPAQPLYPKEVKEAISKMVKHDEL